MSLLCLNGHRHWKSAALLAVLVLSCVAPGCAGQPRAPGPVDLRFSGNALPASGVDDYRAVARSAARVYVKVVVVSSAATVPERGHDSKQRVVSGASGIIVDPAGYVVTAAHIARSTELEARITTLDGREHGARVIHVDADRDMALLKVQGSGNRFPTIERAPGVRRGQPVFAIGTPGNRPGAVTVGHVARPRLARRIGYGAFGFREPMQLAMHVDPGHSGGPVFDLEGALVGMIIAFDLSDDSGQLFNTGIAYAVPAGDLAEFVRDRALRTGNF